MNSKEANQIIIRQNSDQLFGLEIIQRKGFEFVLFDFNIETTISLPAFKRITDLDLESFEQCRSYIEKNTLFQLNIMSLENDQQWQSLAYDFINKCQLQQENEDPVQRRTICLNTTRGKSFLKLLDPTVSTENHTVFLFLISKGTEALHTYLDSDFAVIAQIVECEPDPRQSNPETQDLNASSHMDVQPGTIEPQKTVS